jgi:hypothetical protein
VLSSVHAAPAGESEPVVPEKQNLKKSLPLEPYTQCPAEKPVTVWQLALFEHGGRQMREAATPMQVSLAHSVLSTHELPGCLVAPDSAVAHTQTSCVGPGAETDFSRHVPPPHSVAVQHVSKQRAVPESGFSQNPERQSLFTLHVEPPLLPPDAGGVRCASMAGTQ